MAEYDSGIHGSGWAILGVTLVIGVLTMATTIILLLLPGAAERGARKRHESTVLMAGSAALQRGEPLDLLIHAEFWELVKKHEAESRALGSTGESVFVRFPAAAGRGVPVSKKNGEDEEQRDAETERGSFQQTPATHRASSPKRQKSPAKAADPAPDDKLALPGVTFDRLSLEKFGQQCQGERAE